jgi:histidine kinase-like protein
MSAPRADQESARKPVLATAARSFSIDFGIWLGTPSMARMMTRYMLSEWLVAPESIDVAVLLASELVANAVVFRPAARPRDGYVPYITLALRHSAGLAVIEVSDENENPPEPGDPDLESEGGRGLMLVQALSREWSYYHPRPGWKTVYCVLDAPQRAELCERPAVLGRQDAWAFGSASGVQGPAEAAHWNGWRWRRTALPRGLGGSRVAASASGPDSVWAVTWFSGRVIRWNGRPGHRRRGPVGVRDRRAERHRPGPDRPSDRRPLAGAGRPVAPAGRRPGRPGRPGGIWVVACGHGRQYGSWLLYRSAAGSWTRTLSSRRLEQAVQQLAPVPGTPAWWAAGLTGAPGGGTAAAIYARGPAAPHRAPPPPAGRSRAGQPGG